MKPSDDPPPSPRSAWLRATFGAPALLFVSAAVLTMCLGDGSVTARMGSSIRGLILAPFAAALYGSVLAGVDLVLSVVRVRRLPTGAKAWASGAVATLAGGALSAVLALAIRGVVADETFAGIALVAIVATAFAARFFFGRRPERAAAKEAPPSSAKAASSRAA